MITKVNLMVIPIMFRDVTCIENDDSVERDCK